MVDEMPSSTFLFYSSYTRVWNGKEEWARYAVFCLFTISVRDGRLPPKKGASRQGAVPREMVKTTTAGAGTLPCFVRGIYWCSRSGRSRHVKLSNGMN